MQIQPITPFLGAEIRDVDLGHPLDAREFGRITDWLGRARLLVFRDQRLDGESQIAFSRRFGELEGHVRHAFRDAISPALHQVSNLDADGQPTSAVRTTGNYHWHTDKSYMPVPAFATLLHAKVLPPAGGATCFADMCAAYEALEEPERERLEGLRAVHSWEISRLKSGSPPASAEEIAAAPPVSHPLVRQHPPSGRRALYLGNHAAYVEGWERARGEALLIDLLAHATEARFVYRHQWREGDLVMWDNRALLHRAEADFDHERYPRVLNRTVVRGEAAP